MIRTTSSTTAIVVGFSSLALGCPDNPPVDDPLFCESAQLVELLLPEYHEIKDINLDAASFNKLRRSIEYTHTDTTSRTSRVTISGMADLIGAMWNIHSEHHSIITIQMVLNFKGEACACGNDANAPIDEIFHWMKVFHCRVEEKGKVRKYIVPISNRHPGWLATARNGCSYPIQEIGSASFTRRTPEWVVRGEGDWNGNGAGYSSTCNGISEPLMPYGQHIRTNYYRIDQVRHRDDLELNRSPHTLRPTLSFKVTEPTNPGGCR